MTNTEENDVKTPQVGDIHRFFDNEEEIGQAVCYETEPGVAWSVRVPNERGHEHVLGEVETLEAAEEEINRWRTRTKNIGEQIKELTPGVAFFARHRAIGLAQEENLTAEQGAQVARMIHRASEDGKKFGCEGALYAEPPEFFALGTVLHLHKVRDMGVLEYVPSGETTPMFAAQINTGPYSSHYGRPCKTFDAALLDALGTKYDGDMSQTGLYMAQMLGIED